MTYGQSAYVVNCDKCSYIVEVVNPILGREPIEVSPTSFGLTAANEKIVRTRCPRCGGQVWARFKY